MVETSLDTYLKEIQACSDYLALRDQFGVYDNWPILLHIPELDPILTFLNTHPPYTSVNKGEEPSHVSFGSKKYDYNHKNGIVVLRAYDGGFDASCYIGSKEDRALQQVYYPRGIRLYPYQNEEQQRNAPAWSWIGSIRDVVCELTQDLRKAGIHFSLTHAKLNGNSYITYSPQKPQLSDLDKREKQEYDKLLPRTRNLFI